MGFEFNSITIKGPDDLREALDIETDEDYFVHSMIGMLNRWGGESVSRELYQALYVSKGHKGDQEPLLKPRYENFCRDPYDSGEIRRKND